MTDENSGLPNPNIKPARGEPPPPGGPAPGNPPADKVQEKPATAPARGFLGSLKDLVLSKSPQQPQRSTESMREIVETVVFVVVLVLLLKSFIAEAFVIPTGSMADTLWGYQKVVVCPQCETASPINCSQEVEAQRGQATLPVEYCFCQNCRLRIHLVKEKANAPDEVVDPGPNSGDRVLVVKYPYDLVPGKPNRWDVVVFKFPGDSATDKPFPISGPQQDWVQMNYIKRLVGLGGETIGIWYGDIYRLKDGHTPPADPGVPPIEIWRHRYMHVDDALSLLMGEESPFEILRDRKPDKILAMKRLVYNNDNPAKDLIGKQPPRWAGINDGGAWTTAEPHGFRHVPKEADSLGWLRYRHILRDRGDKPLLITDFLAYNSYYPRRAFSLEPRDPPPHLQPPPALQPPSTTQEPTPPNWVGDLILECEVTVEDAKGDLVLELSKGVDRFRARWDLATGKCTLWRTTGPHEGEKAPADDDFKDIADAMTSLKGKGKYRLRFANVDERLTVWIDGKMPFGDGVNYQAPKKRGPYANDLQPASIGVKGGTVSVHHIKLWRDTYYTTSPGGADSSGLEAADWGDPKKWERLRALSGKTFYVQPGHYLCLGDNSPESSDSRAWGTVPERLMLGRALAVYYPFYFPYWPLKSPVNRVGAIE